MLAVILAAGRGTRLGGLTERRSKPMMPVAGKPMVERVLEMLAAGGVRRFVVVAHPGDAQLLSFLSLPRWSGRIQVAHQDQRLGMAHALAQAAPLVRDAGVDSFLLASCDNLYPPGHVASLIQLRDRHNLDGALTFTLAPREEATASAVVRLEHNLVTEIVEKPRLADVPHYDGDDGGQGTLTAPSLYALSSEVLDYLPRVSPSPRGELEFPSALNLWIAAGAQLEGRRVETRWTLTRPCDLLTLNLHYLRTEPTCCTVASPVPNSTSIEGTVRIEACARVGAGSVLGPEVYLEGGARVGPRTVVRRSVVLRRGVVRPGETVDESVVGSGGRYGCD